MYLMYVDESGDDGLAGSPSKIFVLSGLIIHELMWKECLEQIIDFRKRMLSKYDLFMRDEIHASAFINHPGDLVRIKRNDRLSILRLFTNELASIPYLNIINVIVHKEGKPLSYDVFENGWQVLIQRFENTIFYKNFTGPANPIEKGIIIPDNTNKKKLTHLIRKMRRYNPIPNLNNSGYRNLVLRNTIEDPFLKDSADSYFIQASDLIAFLLYQYKCPNSFMRKKAGDKYFERLEPILCKKASKTNPLGIVEI